MLFAHIDLPTTYSPLHKSEIWKQAIDWIKTNSQKAEQGIYELRGKDMYVNVHGYETLPEEKCRFESHRKYIDLQYCISGGEQIAWQLTSNLIPDGQYDAPVDFQFYKPASHAGILNLTQGCFAVFFPQDAHRPKQYDGINQDIWKLVVKINYSLL